MGLPAPGLGDGCRGRPGQAPNISRCRLDFQPMRSPGPARVSVIAARLLVPLMTMLFAAMPPVPAQAHAQTQAQGHAQSKPAARSQTKGRAHARGATRSGVRARTRANLRSLSERIRAMSRQSSRDAAERQRLTDELRAAELALGQARADLAGSSQALAAQGAQRSALAAQRAATTRELAAARASLAAELRAAYRLRQDDPLRLLLDQQSPLQSERVMTYYGYVSRAAAQRIAHISGEVQRLDLVDAQLSRQQASLSALQQQQALELQTLSTARAQRQQVLASLTSRVHTRAQQLAQLRSQQAGLERLLQRLSHAPRTPRASGTPGAPEPPAALDLTSAFGRLHGQLAWPVSGRLTAQFGQPRASGVRWDGVVIATTRDTPVHAVSGGRVVYADWLPGLGLLIIIDHGAGYLSLYAHNDRLRRPVGATVAAGDVIADAGDTGGRAEPQLYFEIRHDGRPIDPMPWFRASAPTP
jgi:murein hydrolase activator